VRAAARLDRGDGAPQPGPFRLPGRPALECFFSEHIIDVVTEPERYARLGIGFPGAIVLHGPPGSGKTFAVQRLVEHLGWPALNIYSGSVGSPYIHETSRKLAELFDEAAALAPAMVVIDEMEAFVADRHAHQAGGLHHVEETAQLLQRIPEAAAHRVLVIGMTNHLDMIDPAMLRRGRFDHIVEVGMPALDEVAALLDALLGARPVEAALDRATLAAALAGRPLSDAAFVVREAARLAARGGRERSGQADLDAALAELPAAADGGARPIGFVWD
jgi:ATP-dependent 26S proteasome regulatory subunit